MRKRRCDKHGIFLDLAGKCAFCDEEQKQDDNEVRVLGGAPHKGVKVVTKK